jgi:uncharacterized phage-associated protein
MPYQTKALANAVLNKALENGEKLRPLKLQKLMYFVCGYYQAAYGEPLIDSTIEAWDYGPVIPEIYQEFRSFGANEINRPAREYDFESEDFVPVPIPTDDKRLSAVMDFVWSTYGKYTGLQLSEMTHNEGSPWDVTRKKNPGIKNADIQNDVLMDYFSRFIKKKNAE